MEIVDSIKSQIVESNGCWNWIGRKDRGYGIIEHNDRRLRVNRLMAHLFLGMTNLDDPRIVCHKCNNPRCCNPEHLYLGNNKTNAQDRPVITHCINDHEFTEENTEITSQGKRRCRKCHRARRMKSYHRFGR